MMRRILHCLLLLIFIDISIGSVISCGGFVETLNNADRSTIRVRLLTPEGHQKYETECNPDNGYFMIPVYKKGQYKLQVIPPDGWVYERDTHVIDVDGENDDCSKGIDIKFKHIGFVISGKVKSGEIGGPSGFKLGLYTPEGQLVKEAITDDNGKYAFNAVPGSYVVFNVDKEAQCIERGKVPVKVSNAPVVVQPDITIMGHLLTVKVFDESHQKLSGVKISLFSKNKLNLGGFTGQHNQPIVSQGNGGYYYSVETNNGVADFPCLAPAEYEISASHNVDGVQLNFEPDVKSFSMKSQNDVVEFKSSGFSTSGKVMIGNNSVAGAKVYFDNELIGETDNHGSYSVKDVTTGAHKISVQKENFEFDDMRIELSPSSPRIHNMNAKKINVCGTLKIENNLIGDASVKIQSSDDVYTANADNKGSFCIFVNPGKYKVTTKNIPPVTPEVHEIDTTNGPVMNLIFTQFKAKITVHVNCFDNCDNYEVELRDKTGLFAKMPASTNVVFNDVVPRNYYLTVVGKVPTCWDNDKIDIQIEDKDIDNISFKQTGYKVNVNSEYPVNVNYKHLSKSSINGVSKVSANENSFCVPASGDYSLSVKACHQYESENMEMTVPVYKPIDLIPKKALVNVVVTASDVTNEKFQLVMRSDSLGEQLIEETSASKNEHLFNFYVDMSYTGSTLKLIPKSSVFLFKPETLSFLFDGNCNEGKLTFNAEKGVFIEGTIKPSVEGVNIKAVNKNDPNAEILTTTTDKNGKYKIGPVSKESQYEIEVEKPGYKFVKASNNVYNAIKLSELRATFIDIETKEPLGEVLVSISGADNFRSNQVIGTSGTHNYYDLRPGDYYIVPVLQEYQFEKSPAKITVKEGEVASITLEGKRVAWSAHGKVTYLNGRPVGDVKVEALSKDCGNLYEDASTDETGRYRIRGLKLGCNYRISPKITNDEYSLYPPYIKNQVKKQDRKGVDFVMTTFKQTFEMHGKLIFNEDTPQPSSIKVSLLQKNTVLQSVEVIAPIKSFIFVEDSVNNGDVFTVLIEDVKTNRIYENKKEFTVNGPFVSMQFDIRSRQKSADVVITNNNYFGIALISCIALCFLYPEKSRPLFDYGLQLFNSVKTMATENAQRSPENRRRK